MDLVKLNPFVRAAGIREIVYRNDECIAYDARLFYMISGDISITAGGKKYKMPSGSLIYIPAGMPYKFRGHRMLLASVAFDLTDEYADTDTLSPSVPEGFDASLVHACEIAPFDKCIWLENYDDEREAFTELSEIATAAEGEWRAELSALLKLMLVRLSSVASEEALPSRMVRNLDTYIRENRKDEISNTELGAIFGYHPFYISNKLKSAKGVTLHQYIISYRLKLAKRLLEYTDKSVGEIAEEAGFKDASYFTKSFKSGVGMTPKDYRAKFKDDFV